MKVRDLIEHWEQHAAEPLSAREYVFKLPLQDAARVTALAEIYPQRSVETIMTELLSAALDEVEEAFPYIQGTRVVAEDDQGDPIYEDTGPAVRFRTLTARFCRELAEDS